MFTYFPLIVPKNIDFLQDFKLQQVFILNILQYNQTKNWSIYNYTVRSTTRPLSRCKTEISFFVDKCKGRGETVIHFRTKNICLMLKWSLIEDIKPFHFQKSYFTGKSPQRNVQFINKSDIVLLYLDKLVPCVREKWSSIYRWKWNLHFFGEKLQLRFCVGRELNFQNRFGLSSMNGPP